MNSIGKLILVLLAIAIVATMTFAGVTPANAQATFTVNTTDDMDDGTCDMGHCGLREAITAANASPGIDTIEFNIPGAEPHTIQPITVLPTITDPVVIDGYTQPGASLNTSPPELGTNAVLKIELDGSKLEGASALSRVGLNIEGGSSTVRGLVINRCSWGITLNVNGGNFIEGNFIGTDVTGTTSLSNHSGVHIYNWSSNNVIGGATPGACNLISGNNSDAISGYCHWNVVQGNLVGTDASGIAELGNGGYGIRFDNSDNISISDNIVAHSGVGGVIFFSSSNSMIVHNQISSNQSQDGISVSGHGNVITANRITGNDRCGILLSGAEDNILTNNVILNNGRDGIYCYNGSSANISNNTVVGQRGYGIFTDDSSLILINNSIIWRNGDDLDGCTATYSNIRDGDAGEGNISAYPEFVDPENGDYHLKDYSPCIGAGTPTGAPDTDIEDNPRPNPLGSNPDIGAYENSLGVPDTPPDSATIRVPVDYPTIQAAIDAASHGDTVLVADGTYTGAGNKKLDFKGKTITVRSENGPENCIIDCEGDGRGFFFHSVEGKNSVVSGFTITNGRTERGGGIYCKDSSSPTIINCIISQNSTIGIDPEGYFGDGAGILCENSSPKIDSCTFNQNSASWRGGAIYCDSSSPTIIKSIINENTAEQSGGGIMCVESSSSTIKNCVISKNSARFSSGGGLFCGGSSCSLISNCTISENSADEGGGMYCTGSSPSIRNCIFWADSPDEFYVASGDFTVTYSDIEDGYPGDGNISADPMFVDAAGGDYHLQAGSPCIDAGTNNVPEIPDTDFEGDPRIVDGDNDATRTVDMGADEYLQFIEIELDIKPGSYPNSINLKSKGKVPVAVLTTDDFDAYDVDPDTCVFANANPLRWKMEDVDNDSDDDMLFHFKTRELDLTKESTEATLEGETFGGIQIIGRDSVKIVPEGKGYGKKSK